MINKLCEQLGINFPLFMAPMFLASNEAMIQAAIRNGICGIIPTLNYLRKDNLNEALIKLNKFKTNNTYGTYGVNIVIQKSNILYKEHLEICISNKVPFFTTSLGNPADVIKQAHSYGAKVFCDVTNLTHAKKCANVGCDGFIAVGQGAGGHAGPYALQVLIPALKKKFPEIPVIAAGGISTGQGIVSVLALGADAAAMGTRFIASTECAVSDEYKMGIIKAGLEDIVMSERISGTPNSIINTPYAKKIGLKPNLLEKFILNNSATKKYFRMLTQKKGMKLLEKSISPGNYNNLWIAGQSAELIDDIKPCEEIINQIKFETEDILKKIKEKYC